MHLAPTHHRLPRAGIDVIDTPETALAMLDALIERPHRHETIALLLDDQRRGVAIAVVTGTRQPDAVLEVVEYLTTPAAHGGCVGALVVASVRPADWSHSLYGGVCDSDIDRWLELSAIADQADVELIEWFVVGADVTCPRDRLGEPPRW